MAYVSGEDTMTITFRSRGLEARVQPKPFSPVQSARKFSAAFGATSPYSSMSSLLAGSPLILMSR